MDEPKPRKNRKKDQFWRACRYLYPHRGLVIVSIVCALVVGAAFTGGLGTLLPIMQVLIKNGSVQDWVNRKVVEERLDVRLTDDIHEIRVADLGHGHKAETQVLKVGQRITSIDGADSAALLDQLAKTNQKTSWVEVD